MQIDASLLLISFPPSLLRPPWQTRNVDLKAADGVVLKASDSSPGTRRPGILLFHQCSENGSRRLWDGLARDLVAAGFHVMTFNNRRFGETSGRPRRGLRDPALCHLRLEAGMQALAYLLAQKDVDPTRLPWAARRRDIRAVFLFSGLPSLGGRAYLLRLRDCQGSAATLNGTSAQTPCAARSAWRSIHSRR